jgi:hypothetical protein
MMYLCNLCAPEDAELYHIGYRITGVCENNNCEQVDFPVDQVPVINYVLRLQFEGIN